jgi:thioredoxin 1
VNQNLKRILTVGAILGVVLFVLAALGKGEATPEPRVFTKVSIADGRAQIAGTPKLLIVDVWASWCPPCLQMKRETWIDARVEEWISANAIAIALDADNAGEEGSGLHVRYLPTIIVYADRGKGVEEVDRKIGFVGPQETVEWLAKLKLPA